MQATPEAAGVGSLEQRVAALEAEVAELKSLLNALTSG